MNVFHIIIFITVKWIKNLFWWRTWGVWIAKDMIYKNLELYIPVRMQPNKYTGDSQNIDGWPKAIHSLQLHRGLMLLYSSWWLFPVMVLENERQQCLCCAGFEQFISYPCVFRVRYLISTDLQCWRLVVEPEMYLLALFVPMAGDTQCWPGTRPTDGISIGFGFQSGFGGFGLGRRDCYTVVACARFGWDRWGTFWARARQILVGFRVRSGYHWWDGRQRCEICTCTSILMTKISFHFLFLSWISVVRLLYYVM